MSINASAYVVSYRSPTAPRISVNVRDTSIEEFESAVTVYNSEASAYVEDYRAVVENKDYVQDRLRKDLCAEKTGMTSGGIDYEHNTVSLHVKADDLYENALGDNSLSTAGGVNAVASSFNALYDTYCTESGAFVLQSLYEAAVVYDARAFTVSSAVGSVASGSVFILDRPNQSGLGRTFTNYSGLSPQYVLACEGEYPIGSSSVSDAWVIRTADATSSVVAYSVDEELGDSMTWSVPNP